MFGFIKKSFFFTAIAISGCNVLNVNSLNAIQLKCVSVNNQECKVRPEI